MSNLPEYKYCGIDPGMSGSIVFIGPNDFTYYAMPYREKEIDFEGIVKILQSHTGVHVFLERAIPMAMGSKHAFTFGRSFMAIELAIKAVGHAVTYVEPSKWSKVMHDGISSDLKPKAKSVIAVERLFPKFFKDIPKTKTGKLNEGVTDALLIAGYGARTLFKDVS